MTTESALTAANDPRYVTPASDSREHPVPCHVCRQPTWALRAVHPSCPR